MHGLRLCEFSGIVLVDMDAVVARDRILDVVADGVCDQHAGDFATGFAIGSMLADEFCGGLWLPMPLI